MIRSVLAVTVLILIAVACESAPTALQRTSAPAPDLAQADLVASGTSSCTILHCVQFFGNKLAVQASPVDDPDAWFRISMDRILILKTDGTVRHRLNLPAQYVSFDGVELIEGIATGTDWRVDLRREMTRSWLDLPIALFGTMAFSEDETLGSRAHLDFRTANWDAAQIPEDDRFAVDLTFKGPPGNTPAVERDTEGVVTHVRIGAWTMSFPHSAVIDNITVADYGFQILERGDGYITVRLVFDRFNILAFN